MATPPKHLTIRAYLDNGDGTHLTGVLTYTATTGAPVSLAIANTSATLTAVAHFLVNGVDEALTVPPGGISFTATQMAAQGWTDVLTQFGGFTIASV